MMIYKLNTSNSQTFDPLISFVILAYNQEKFIRDAVEGAFSQSYSPLEIILSDDFSADATFEIIEAMANAYHGPHDVIINRNEKNLGLCGHVNKILEISSSDMIILAAGDDISMPDRAKRSWELLNNNKDCTCLSFNTIVFHDDYDKKDTQIQPLNSFTKYSIDELMINSDFHIGGASRTFRKSAILSFGPLMPETPTEDSTILLRCLLTGQVMKSDETQIFYRLHGDNYYASMNKYYINYEKIHLQYMNDLQKALEFGFINEEKFLKIEKSLQRKLRRRIINSEFNQSDKKINYFILSIVFSKVIYKKEKIQYLKKALKNFNFKKDI